MIERGAESRAIVDALEDLFARERQGLLAGDLDSVLRLAEQRDPLLREVPSLGLGEAVLTRLRAQAARNAGLLAAAAQGVRAADARIRSLIEGSAPLDTYDGSGKRVRLGGPEAATLRRL